MKALNFYGRFLLSFTAIGYMARGLPWKPIRERLDGQTWLVTGATGGIGRAVACAAAAAGARVYAVGRRKDALEELVVSAGPNIVPMARDLSLIRDNLALADELPTVDVLINNVGILKADYAATPEGFSTMYATNLLGGYALTQRLIKAGKLNRSVVVNVSSGGLYNASLNLEHIDAPEARFNAFAAYATQKRIQIVLSDVWDQPCDGLRAFTMHPGWVRTAGVAGALPRMNRYIGLLLRSAAQGADTIFWLAAKRPASRPGRPWFDRESRAAHVYQRTRQPRVTPEQVLARLESDLIRVERGQ